MFTRRTSFKALAAIPLLLAGKQLVVKAPLTAENVVCDSVPGWVAYFYPAGNAAARAEIDKIARDNLTSPVFICTHVKGCDNWVRIEHATGT